MKTETTDYRKKMTPSSDELMKPIFEDFDRIFAYINGYSDDFLPNANFQILPRCETDV